MIWYLIFTVFVAALGAFTFWLRKKEKVKDQAPTNKPYTEEDEIED
ncbi:hypothetical protein H1164_17040 [Thermoactinomyces daqus]|uniref:Uncharacterized protein n=1 Tax=Thermoactinomyces daqus TaxID=1329516 RepID=A0A7W1XDG4_9BACL|nr:hypothetical protein [Thermoactinomyces daqus]MBA4544537.1 hypothetical protein [Thermoactinomyces daqus]